MRKPVMHHLLMKVPKKSLVQTVINTFETLFKDDPKGLKEAYHEMAIIIQAHSVINGKSNIDGFTEPFKSEIQKYIISINNQEVRTQ